MSSGNQLKKEASSVRPHAHIQIVRHRFAMWFKLNPDKLNQNTHPTTHGEKVATLHTTTWLSFPFFKVMLKMRTQPRSRRRMIWTVGFEDERVDVSVLARARATGRRLQILLLPHLLDHGRSRLGCSGHVSTLYYSTVWAPERIATAFKYPLHSLPPLYLTDIFR